MLQNNTELEIIAFDSPIDHANFRQELDFYLKKKQKHHKKIKQFEKRQESCDPNNMFDNLLDLIENKDK